MAEGERPNNDSWESWLGGWVQTAKEKSNSALEMVKKDLAEFTCTIQKDTERAVEMTKESLNKENTANATNRVKAGLTSFLDNISRVLVIPPDDNYVPVKVAPDGSGLYDRGKARLHAIQLDASTYMDPPDGPPEQYSMWLESFNMDEHKGEISELLVSKVEVRALYTKLVPTEVSHAEFWQRYIYRVHQLHCDEARKQALMKRADQTKGDSFSWDDDDDWSGGEDEDNHSDWEKMPRPQHLPTAEVEPVSTHQSEKQLRESSVEATVEKDLAHVNIEPAALVTTCKVDGPGAELTDQIDKDIVEENVETNASVFVQDDKPEPENNAPTGIPLEPQASDDIEDASEDFVSHSELQMPSADLWSLHIPSDTASASQFEQDSEYMEGVHEQRSRLDIYRQTQELQGVSEGSDSCAAGGDVASVADDASGITMADGASGIVDIESVPTRENHVLEPSPDISAASVCISDEPLSAQIPCQDMSSIEEIAHTSEQSSVITPNHGSNAEGQPDPVPAAASPVASIVEVVPVFDKDTLQSENAEESSNNAEESSVSNTSTAAPDNTTVSQQIPDNSNKQNDEAPESVQASPQTTILVPESIDPVALPNPADGGEMKEMGMRLKGDMVVVGDRDSPLSSESNDTKEIGLEEDWEQDFDIEVTEDDLKTAENIAKQLGENLNAGDDDWENWE